MVLPVLPQDLGARPTITRGLEAWHTSRKDAQGTYLLQTPAHDDLYDLYQNQCKTVVTVVTVVTHLASLENRQIHGWILPDQIL